MNKQFDKVKNLTIHIGFRKTGTSSLQTALTRMYSKEIASDISFWYPKCGRPPAWPYAHHDLLNKLQIDPAGVARELMQEASEIEGDSIHAVFSCEELSLPHRIWLIRRLRAIFPDARTNIVCFVRAFDKWIESMYSEDVKRGRTIEAPWEYATRLMGERKIFGQIERVKAANEDAKITVLSFNPKSIVADGLAAILGSKIAEDIRIWENHSLSPMTTLVLREVYRSSQYKEDLLEKYIHNAYILDNKIGKLVRGSFFTPEQRIDMFDRCYNETMDISQNYLGILDPFWLPDIDTPYWRMDGKDLVKDFMLLLLSGQDIGG